MAMLAEPRRKQKWSVDPRNSTWSKDESKFGQKMLEKMGWSKGKGLGAQEQGATEHIKVQVKNNTLGLGASNNYEDNWIAHQDDFNQLLAELNSHHGTGSAASSDSENKKSFSLEEKSKSSKKRVHYMKFAKGKDLSCRSDTDLACIFGKREKAKKSPKSPKEETDSDPSPSPTPENEAGNTVTSSLSVNEYFAKRMAALKKSNGRESVTENVEQDPEEDYLEDTQKKSKKRKQRKNDDDPSEELEVEKNLRDENDVDTTDGQERRRRKSKKRSEEEDFDVDNSEEDETRRKKKKSEEEDLDEDNSVEDETRRKKKKKKNKRKRQREDVTSAPHEEDQLKKKKKKNQKRTE